MKNLLHLSWLLAATGFAQQTVETVKVIAKPSESVRKLPGEFEPWQKVDVAARISGYIEQLPVDRGSVVRKGDLIARLSAPEMDARIAEAKSRVEAQQAQKAEAEARLAAAQVTLERLKTAAETAGAVSGQEITLAEKAVDAARQVVTGIERSIVALQAAVKAQEDLKAYLEVTAPFDGAITERYQHPGALAGPGKGPIVRLEQLGRLRLVVAVPEPDIAGLIPGARVAFTVPAYPGQTFTGTVARAARVLDAKTRTMPVELDVANPGGRLAPGMYPEAQWPVRKGTIALLVPATAVATTTERSFVIRLEEGKARYVAVKKGAAHGELVEILGAVKEGDTLVRRASDELREGTALRAK